MPVDPSAPIEVTAFAWVPDFARGQVRDLRVRWALEEVGESYRTRLLGGERSADYYREQPWGQVPTYTEGSLHLFESGAIVLHIAEQHEILLPRDPVGRGRAICWLFAALNTVEPPAMALANAELFNADKDWSAGAATTFSENVAGRLARLSDWLGTSEWLEQSFTVGDLMMIATLRGIGDGSLVRAQPNLAAYVARGEQRPAFQRALAAQMGDFVADPV